MECDELIRIEKKPMTYLTNIGICKSMQEFNMCMSEGNRGAVDAAQRLRECLAGLEQPIALILAPASVAWKRYSSR